MKLAAQFFDLLFSTKSNSFFLPFQVVGQQLVVPRQAAGNFSTASVEIVFQRRVVYHLLNIFLQSFFLVLTGYMSLFFSVSNFSDRWRKHFIRHLIGGGSKMLVQLKKLLKTCSKIPDIILSNF